jgi:hypothetical protein
MVVDRRFSFLNMAKKKERQKKINWAKIEKEYRVGQLSTRALARKYKTGESAIRWRVKTYGWERDLKDTFDKALGDAIIKQTAQETAQKNDNTAQCAKSDDEVIQEAVDTSIEVIKKHRAHIFQLHNLADQAFECVNGILKAKSVEGYEWMFGTGKESVMTMLQKLTSVRSKAIELERQAYNLDKPDKEQNNKKPQFNIINYADADDSL